MNSIKIAKINYILFGALIILVIIAGIVQITKKTDDKKNESTNIETIKKNSYAFTGEFVKSDVVGGKISIKIISGQNAAKEWVGNEMQYNINSNSYIQNEIGDKIELKDIKEKAQLSGSGIINGQNYNLVSLKVLPSS